METIQSAMKTAFQTVQTDVTSMISACVPFALTIIGTVLAVTLGIKVFKKAHRAGVVFRKIVITLKRVRDFKCPYPFLYLNIHAASFGSELICRKNEIH